MTNVPFLDLPAMTAEIRPAVDRAFAGILDSGAFIGGQAVADFEAAFATYCQRQHAIGVGNGTDALQLVLMALGIGRGDEVIVPANTFVATAEAVALVGATPVFVDVDPDTLLVTPDLVVESLTHRTAAVLAVSLYGQTPDLVGLERLCRARGIALVEDAAQSQGATWGGRRSGSFGTAACFSFYPGKNLGAAGDAGAVVTDDAELADRIRSLANHGRTTHHQHEIVGLNSRLDALQAVFLSAKLERLDDWNAARRRHAARYRAGLASTAAVPVATAPQATPVVHLQVVQVDGRDELREDLAQLGIQTGIHYPVPCHLTPAFAAWATRPLPVAERAAQRILSLPMFPHLATEQVDRVVEAVAARRSLQAIA